LADTFGAGVVPPASPWVTGAAGGLVSIGALSVLEGALEAGFFLVLVASAGTVDSVDLVRALGGVGGAEADGLAGVCFFAGAFLVGAAGVTVVAVDLVLAGGFAAVFFWVRAGAGVLTRFDSDTGCWAGRRSSNPPPVSVTKSSSIMDRLRGAAALIA